MRIFDSTLDTLQQAMDVRLARHQLLAGDVANANTPGYVPRDLDFAAAMRQPPGEQGAPAAIPVPRGEMTFASAGHALAGQAPSAAADTGGDIPLAVAEPGAVPPMGAEGAAPTAAAGLDGNAVDVDRALAAVAENALQYGAAARAAQKKLAILRYVASDGAA